MKAYMRLQRTSIPTDVTDCYDVTILMSFSMFRYLFLKDLLDYISDVSWQSRRNYIEKVAIIAMYCH